MSVNKVWSLLLVWNFKIWYSGNRLPEDVIDYQWPKRFLKYFWKHLINYTILVINYQQLILFITPIKNLNSNFKACNRLHKTCNRLPGGIFENNSQESHLFKSFFNSFQRPINRWLGTRISLEFFCTKSLIPSKTKLSYPLKHSLAKTLANSIRNHWVIFIISSFS